MSKSKSSREREARKVQEMLARRKATPPKVLPVLIAYGQSEIRRKITKEGLLGKIGFEVIAEWFGVPWPVLANMGKDVGAYLADSIQVYVDALQSEPKFDPDDPVSVLDSLRYWSPYIGDTAEERKLHESAIFHATPYSFGDLISNLEGDQAVILFDKGQQSKQPDDICLFLALTPERQWAAFLAADKDGATHIQVFFRNDGCWETKPGIRVKGRQIDCLSSEQDEEEARSWAVSVAMAIGLLNTHGGYRYANDEPQRKPKLAAIEGEVSSAPEDTKRLRIVYVNKMETIRPMVEREHGEGSPKSPHDRRGTWCTSKLGNRFWRKGAKVHGGEIEPVVNVVKLAKPLTSRTEGHRAG